MSIVMCAKRAHSRQYHLKCHVFNANRFRNNDTSSQGIYITRYVFIHFVCTFKSTSLTIKLIQRFQAGLPDAKSQKYITQPLLCPVSLTSLDQLSKVLGLLKVHFSIGYEDKNIPSRSIYLGKTYSALLTSGGLLSKMAFFKWV